MSEKRIHQHIFVGKSCSLMLTVKRGACVFLIVFFKVKSKEMAMASIIITPQLIPK